MTNTLAAVITLVLGGAQVDRDAIAVDLSERCQCEVRIVDSDAVAAGAQPDFYVTILNAGDPGYDSKQLGRSRIGTRFAIVQLDAIRSLPGYQSVLESRAVSGVLWHELIHLVRGTRDHDDSGLMRAKTSWGDLMSTREVTP
jgi:hypothetical protein